MADEWSFLHACDSHLGSPRSFRFRPAVNERWAAIKDQMVALKPDLLLHGGDLTRDGEVHEEEYQLAREDLDTLPFPSFVIPGNMDVGNKHTSRRGTKRPWDDVALNLTCERLDLFSSYFGPIHWTFLHRNVRFTGFFAAVAGTGFPHEARFWSFLERLPRLQGAVHHVAMMHYWPFIDTPDEPQWDITDPDQYDGWYFSIDAIQRERMLSLMKAARVDILFCGHVHTRRPVQDVDGLRIYRSASAGSKNTQMKERWPDCANEVGFHRCVVTADSIAVEFVPGSNQCDEHDTYGPWGHPTRGERDYSIARVKPSFVPR